jgi:hypothetical protein
MRVRISFDALRLCLLVAAGVTSGYLWRAAFESSSPAEQRVAATPPIVEQTPSPPTVRLVPHHLTRTKPAVVRTVGNRPVVRAQGSPSALISSHAPAASPSTPAPHSPTPTPTPTPNPTSPPPSKPPAPAPNPPPTTTTTPPPVAAPVQQSVSPPPTTTPTTSPPPPPPTTTSRDDSRPGWGNGDKNHDHSGPGGGDEDHGDNGGHGGKGK